MNVIHGNERAVFVGNAAGSLFELGAVRRSPPVCKIADGIELTSLVVETMRQLVPNDDPDSPIVDRFIFRAVEERRLKYSRRKVNVVFGGVVIRIDRGRRHAPFTFVER